MQSPFADDLGPAKTVHVHEPTLGLEAVLVVDNVARGPSIGGLRMAPGVSAEDALGGIPLDELGATGWGIRHAAEVAAPYSHLDLRGARVVIQGFGAVGKHSARFLAERGAILIAASDSGGAIHDAAGIDVARLIALKDGGGSVTDYDRGRRLDRDAILDVDCDIWIPAARPDVVREDNVDRLKTRMEYRGATRAAAFAMIEEQIRMNTGAVLEEADRKHVSPRRAALDLATTRVKQAMSYRRFSIL